MLFLIGSALCGLAQGMTELIAFRAIQGLGGGGLMVSAQAAIGDVVSPRERGRYLGLFGAVFGRRERGRAADRRLLHDATRAGAGSSTSTCRWGCSRSWCSRSRCPARGERVRHRVDYLGTALLGVCLASLVLLTTLGGTTYDWDSPFIVGLGVLAVAGPGRVRRRRAARPPSRCSPPSCFATRSFRVTSAISFVVGFALFGALTYLPLFQQVVRGLSPTASGLQLIPLMAGLLAASIGSGQVISRTGRYKVVPDPRAPRSRPSGCCCSRAWTPDTGTLEAAAYMLVLGVGLGFVMQVLVLAVQNAVPYAQLGIATSSATLFRSIGGSLGHGDPRRDLRQPARRTSSPRGCRRAPPRRALDLRRGEPGAGAVAAAGAARRASCVSFTDSLSTVFVIAAAVVAVRVRAGLDPGGAAAAADDRGPRPRRRLPPPQDTDSLQRDHARAEPLRRARAHAPLHRAGDRGRRRRPDAGGGVAARRAEDGAITRRTPWRSAIPGTGWHCAGPGAAQGRGLDRKLRPAGALTAAGQAITSRAGRRPPAELRVPGRRLAARGSRARCRDRQALGRAGSALAPRDRCARA